jgi:hypothetical protein
MALAAAAIARSLQKSRRCTLAPVPKRLIALHERRGDGSNWGGLLSTIQLSFNFGESQRQTHLLREDDGGEGEGLALAKMDPEEGAS